MPIQVNCPQCGAQFSLPDGLLGREVRCTRCQRVFRAEASKPAQEALPEVIPVHVPAVEEPPPQAIQQEPVLRRRSSPVPLPANKTRRSAAEPEGSNQVWIIAGGIIAFLLIGGGIATWVALSSSSPEPPDQVAGGKDKQGDQGRIVRDKDDRPGNLRDERPPRDKPAERPGDRQPIVQKPPVPKINLPPLPDPVEIKPAPVAEEGSVKLPEQAGGLRVGGGGRFLILHFPKIRKLGIFDANTAKIERYISVPEDNVVFAGGMTQLIVYVPSSGTMLRYNLLTGEQEHSGKMLLPPGKIDAFCMGHASAGPLLIGIAGNRAHLYDIDKFKEILLPPPEGDGADNGPVDRRLEEGYYWAGATGRVFGNTGNYGQPNGIKTLVYEDGDMKPYSKHDGTWYVMPGPDDHHVYPGGHGVVTERVQKVDHVPFSMGDNSGFASHLYLPAHHGPYYLHAQTIDFGGGGDTPLGTIRLFVLGDKQPIATYNKTAVCKYGWEGLKGFGIEHSIHLIPKAKLLVIVPESRQELRLYPADLEAALDKSGRNFLLFTSSPPQNFQKGKAFVYQAEAKAKKGPATFKLASAPRGMTVDATGTVRWEVPADYTGSRADVILTAKDTAGQETFQSFKLMAK